VWARVALHVAIGKALTKGKPVQIDQIDRCSGQGFFG
jgi:hypothetical protein